MMTRTNRLYARTGATAIAAALALSSTPGLAQQVQTIPSTPAPTTTTTTTTVTTPAPAPATEQGPAADATTTTDTTTAAEAVPVKRVTTTVKHPAVVATRAQAQSLARTLADRSAARPATPAAATAAPAIPVAAAATTPGPAIANPAASQAPAKPSSGIDERTLELGGGALALLALGGAAFAVTRRRRDDDEEAWSDETVEAEHVAQPEPAVHDELPQAAIVAPAASAFAWGDRAPMENAEPHGSAMADDRLPGESWTERAQRGPSHDNPSLSLKKRLKRAAFFDQREHEVAAGSAVPVDADAGLPEAMTDELESA